MPDRHAKRTLTPEQQVAHLREKSGVSFDLVSERDACRMHACDDFFFRVKAFAKNFEKYRSDASGKAGKYVNLDFGHLVELARLDDALRTQILAMTLDIEHAMKVRVNAAAMRAGIDPYTLVEEFLVLVERGVIKEQVARFDPRAAEVAFIGIADALGRWRCCNDPGEVVELANRVSEAVNAVTLGKSPHHIADSFSAMESSPYARNLVARYSEGDMPYWCLMELVSLGPMIKLYRACFRKNGLIADEGEAAVFARVSKLLRCVQTMRNSAAHSDHLIHELAKADKGSSLRAVRSALEEYLVDAEAVNRVSRMRAAMDTAATLICYDALVESEGLRRATARRLAECRARMVQHMKWFDKNYACNSFLSFIDDAFGRFSARFDAR